MSKVIAITAATLIFFIASLAAIAGPVTFEKEYTYQASDMDSKMSCRTIALEQTKRLLLEELGTYLITETEVKNYQITKDQITTLTAGIVMTKIVEEKWDGKTYYLKAMIAADPTEVVKSVDALRKDKHKSEELEKSKKQAEEALREVELLRKELETVKNQEKYNKAINKLSAFDWFDRALALGIDDEKAVEALTRAIELNPAFASAYLIRGLEYAVLKEHELAIQDFTRVIELKPKLNILALVYAQRGEDYGSLGKYQEAVKDYNKAIELSHKTTNNIVPTLEEESYFGRGTMYAKLGDPKKAIQDYNKAIELNPGYSKAHTNRGIARGMLGKYEQAEDDLIKATTLDPKNADAWYNLGVALSKKGMELKMRGDQRADANDDIMLDCYRKAARLGHKPAQDLLSSLNFTW